MEHNDWQSEEAKELDLMLENQNLQNEISLRGGYTEKNDDLDPRLENEFLRNVLAFEEADEEEPVPIRSIFPDDYSFPVASTMSEKELETKVGDIEERLSQHHIEVGFANELPIDVLYSCLREMCVSEDFNPATADAGFSFVLDGCSGYCPDCLQKPYCKNAEELYGDEDDEWKGESEEE